MRIPEATGTIRVPIPSGDPAPPWWKRVPSARRLIVFSFLTFVLALGTLVGGFAYIHQIPENPGGGVIFGEGGLIDLVSQSPGQRAFQGKKRMNILCLGIDYNYNEKGIHYTKGARSDTIFVVSVDAEGKILNVLSIPRDTQVFIGEEYGYDKINTAYSYGGIEQAKATVGQFLGITIDHHVIIKVSGAKTLVDAIGGLSVKVEKDMDYDDNWGNLHIHLKKGPQVLNGEQAVGYARFRMDEEGDRGRIRRQQQVMEALMRRLKDPTVALRLPAIVKAVKENVDTDFGVLDMLDLTYLYRDFDRKRMKTGAIVGDDADINGVSFIIPYAPENEKIVRELLKEPADIARTDVRVEVLNGSGDEAAAGAVAEELRKEGYQVVRVADADRSDYEYTRVVDHLGSAAVKSSLDRVLRGAVYERDPKAGTGARFDVTIIVGRDRTGGAAAAAPPAPDYPQAGSSYREPAYHPEPVPEEPAPEEPPAEAPPVEEAPVEEAPPVEESAPAPAPPTPAAEPVAPPPAPPAAEPPPATPAAPVAPPPAPVPTSEPLAPPPEPAPTEGQM